MPRAHAGDMLRGLAALAAASLTAACTGAASTLDPAGPHAARIAQTAWIMTGLSIAVVVIVAVPLVVALLRRSRNELWPKGRLSDTTLIVGGGILLPAIVLPLLWALTLRDMRAFAEAPASASLTVEVTAHQWWYEVRYPAYGLVLRDEVYLPVDQAVLLRVTSDDVIHSFWVPRLAGKIDMIPGRTNELVVEASAPGSYLVECAEFCGVWHARMQMRIIAESVTAFETRMRDGR